MRLGNFGVMIALVPSLLAAPPAAGTQPPGKAARIGMLTVANPRSANFYVAFEQRLRELDHVEGQNLAIEFRSAEGRPELLPNLAAELVRLKVDLIFAPGPEAVLRAARQTAHTIRIVMVAVDFDPIAGGYIAGLPRPGGNITGVFTQRLELTRKQVEILKEALPKVSRMAAFWDSLAGDQLREAAAAARLLGIQL